MCVCVLGGGSRGDTRSGGVGCGGYAGLLLALAH